MNRFIQIDEEGNFCFEGLRLEDAKEGKKLFENLKKDDLQRLVTNFEGKEVFVEAFDAPFIVQQVFTKNNNSWVALMPYGLKRTFELKNLTLDEWDRFHGFFEDGLSFVFSRKAQAEFFLLLTSFTDDTITFNKKTYSIPSCFEDFSESNFENFWTNIYLTESPKWDLNKPSPLLVSALPQLKIPKSRIAVLGCGGGHDAAFFAQHGHIVTAFDISSEAIQKSQKNYSHIRNLSFHKADAFALSEFNSQFDLCFEHTFYCAIAPSKRNDLIKVWQRLLTDQGLLFGIFFVHNKSSGPPYGGSEWEIRKRLNGAFQPMYWTRAKNSIQRRLSKELLVYARKQTD